MTLSDALIVLMRLDADLQAGAAEIKSMFSADKHSIKQSHLSAAHRALSDAQGLVADEIKCLQAQIEAEQRIEVEEKSDDYPIP